MSGCRAQSCSMRSSPSWAPDTRCGPRGSRSRAEARGLGAAPGRGSHPTGRTPATTCALPRGWKLGVRLGSCMRFNLPRSQVEGGVWPGSRREMLSTAEQRSGNGGGGVVSPRVRRPFQRLSSTHVRKNHACVAPVLSRLVSRFLADDGGGVVMVPVRADQPSGAAGACARGDPVCPVRSP